MDGIIAVYKEAGWTSFDVVAKLRGILKTRKLGHAGTLDPSVEGVLPVCVNRATKVVEYLHEAPKTYEGRIVLGVSTTTEDADGEVVESADASAITDARIDAAIAEFVGIVTQTPPMYSAVKVNGRRLYEYARRGEIVERPSREVNIYSFKRTSDVARVGSTAEFAFEVECSKGTYVRTLSVDLGASLGVPAHMSFLIRTKSAGITLDKTLKLAEITIDTPLISLEEALDFMPSFEFNDEELARALNGSKFEQIPDMQDADYLAKHDGRAIGIYVKDPKHEGLMRPKRILYVQENA
ncbi:MAG: tRNA pseudouridine(55) synthase TruB [Lactobacillales bacterium]|jgi:tRNA pseudouridine55 synthase|nr:tRNA pseudouridine(55) synthase TruB [Lactobacillales bacterium]